MKKWIPFLLFFTVLIIWAIVLKQEFTCVLIWWSVFFIIGLMYYPLSRKVFQTFTDKGFLFSKVIGLAISSYLLWLLSLLKIFPISRVNCWGVVVVPGLFMYFLLFKNKEDIQTISSDKEALPWILGGEGLFLFSLGFWTYLRGFNPKIEGLEKFMDYGFVNSILCSQYNPPNDMWFAGESINYYYFGQYVTAFVTRLSGLETEITYNLMMAVLFAFSMGLCFTITSNLIKGYGKRRNVWVVFGGLISAALVSLGGNLHSFFYGLLSKLTKDGDSYWFPDATRYIGYNPPTKDKTIHEFPLYSFVVSDLHAHVINMIFVLTLLGISIAIFRKYQKRINENRQPGNLLQEIFIPEFLLLGLLIGIFQMSNYWDFPIYLTVTMFVLICVGIRQYGYNRKMLIVMLLRFVIIQITALIIALPFRLTFKNVTMGIGLATERSMPHQLLVLWGYQLTLAVLFFIQIFYTEQNVCWKREKGKKRMQIRNEMTLVKRIRTVLDESALEDVFVLILFVSAVGLLIIPELVYVRDIYAAEHKRANTMFKLTYQAFIMFGLAAGYVVARIGQYPSKEWKINISRILAAVMITLPMIYPFYAVPSWYNHLKTEEYQGIDGLVFLKKDYPDDYELIQWLRKNISGQPVILEANGDSYTYYGRISMATGFPTIQGWYVHEWLWRGNHTIVTERVDAVRTIYESDDVNMTKEILEKYDVEYIVIGKLEKKAFPELKEDKLLSMGNVVFERPEIKLIQLE